MPDNRDLRGPPDTEFISLTEPYEVEYWTRALGVSHEVLNQIVLEVGHSAKAVRAWLEEHK